VREAAAHREPVEIITCDDAGACPALIVDGAEVAVLAGQDPEVVGIAVAAAEARRCGHPVPAVLIADRGSFRWRLLVHPDGSATDDPSTPPPPVRRPGRRPRLRGGLVVAGVAVLVLDGGAALVVSDTPTGPPEDVVASGTPSVAPASPSGLPEILGSPTVPPTPDLTRVSAIPQPRSAARAAGPVVPGSARAPAGAGGARVETDAATPSAPVPPAPETAVASAPAAPVALVARTVVVRDSTGQCLTASGDGSAVWTAGCNHSLGQSWTYIAGELRQGSRCLTVGSGVGITNCAVASASARTWRPSSRATVHPGTGLCLERTGTQTVRATQCGTGRTMTVI
jgi:hypothetical protein